ncbi:MAG: OmpA family protein [Faecousia sp.]
MKKRRTGSVPGDKGSEQGFWPSYTDMMSAVALILFFLMLLAYIQNIITNNDLRQKEQELRSTLEQLSLTSIQVEDKEKELKDVSDTLETARQDLDIQQMALDAQQALLKEQEERLAQQQADIEAQQSTIEAQQAQMERQQIYLNDTQAELTQAREEMQAVAFLRLDIVKGIKDSMEEVMGTENSITISDTGNLVLSESVLFARGSYELKENSRLVLDQLALGLASFLGTSDSIQYVDTIVIGGHADITGGDEINRKLSSNRANTVLSYLMTTQNGCLSPFAEYFCAAGYGSTRPVADNSTFEGQALNRRIEISVILKDESVLDALDKYLAIEMPEANTDSTASTVTPES